MFSGSMCTGDEHIDLETDCGRDCSVYSYDDLKNLDPVAANRIHPNNHRKVRGFDWFRCLDFLCMAIHL